MRESWQCEVCEASGRERLMAGCYRAVLCVEHERILDRYIREQDPTWAACLQIKCEAAYWFAQAQAIPDAQGDIRAKLLTLQQESLRLLGSIFNLIEAWITRAAAAHAEKGVQP